MSSLEISAMRRSRSDLLAVETAFFAASSQELVLVPMTSMTRYTPSPPPFLAMPFLLSNVSRRRGLRAGAFTHHTLLPRQRPNRGRTCEIDAHPSDSALCRPAPIALTSTDAARL